jgi:hypothetical protein
MKNTFFLILVSTFFTLNLYSQAQLSLSFGNRDFNVVQSDIFSDHHGDEYTTGYGTFEFEVFFYKQSRTGWGWIFGGEGHMNTAGHTGVNLCFGPYQNFMLFNRLHQAKFQVNVGVYEVNAFVGVRSFPINSNDEFLNRFFLEIKYDLARDDKHPVFEIGHSLPINY